MAAIDYGLNHDLYFGDKTGKNLASVVNDLTDNDKHEDADFIDGTEPQPSNRSNRPSNLQTDIGRQPQEYVPGYGLITAARRFDGTTGITAKIKVPQGSAAKGQLDTAHIFKLVPKLAAQAGHMPWFLTLRQP